MSSKNNEAVPAAEDAAFMRLALKQAAEAASAGEVPIGAVAVVAGEAVAFARNRVEEKNSAVAHAEIELLHRLGTLRGDWRMEDVTVYVTKEPCPMCAGALVNARVRRIVCGVTDPRFGGCTVFGIPSNPGALWNPAVVSGVCAAEAEELLAEFFRSARAERRKLPLCIRKHFDPEYAAMLRGLTRRVFDFDLDFWFNLGCWTDAYESSALIEDGRMLAHAGLCRLRLRVAGREFAAIQLNSVCTASEARGRGYARRLIDGILRRYSGTPVFLFANNSVTDFYPKFGFRPAKEMFPVAYEAIDNELAPVKCAPEELRATAEKRRRPASDIFDVPDAGRIPCFHLFGEYADKLYRLAPGLAVAAEQEGETLRLCEIFAERAVHWTRLRELLPFRGVRRVEFGFCPDRLGVEFRWEEPEESTGLFLCGDWNLPEQFRIPRFAST